MSFFELLDVDGLRRSGVLHTRRGDILTPTFMPVGTKAAVKGVHPIWVEEAGANVLLCNTYHLHVQPGEGVVKQLGGLHNFMKWDKPILTDSGGFQVFSLAKVRKITEEGVRFQDPKSGDEIFITPEISMQIQFALGSDIIMAFDDLTGLGENERHRASEAVERTHRWLERCIAEFNRLSKGMTKTERPLLFGIFQGGLDKDLRKKSIEYVQSTAVDGIAIGGLSVGESRAEMHYMLDYLSDLYDPLRPHYLMGVGDPVDLRFAYDHGIDMADCVLPTRNARHATVWSTGDTKLHLTNLSMELDSGPIMPDCDCMTCMQGFSRSYLRHEFKQQETLAGSLASVHNLRYLIRLAENYRKH